ncbi:MAG: GMC family oxidoreductase [unclassified Hahellaceae]|nr:GMC family oxidoreductase [Hahellaceae bacterium]|tara:strand:- start:5790 stop:7427 length:1638 start_codon:yes stop_codon:yes gene_type:complete
MSVQDVITLGLERGWQVFSARPDSEIDNANRDFIKPVSAMTELEFDVIVIGTGAGGGTAAETFAQQGLSVLMLEEGRLHSLKDFKMEELWSYGNLYQEALARTTEDAGISIMQGRSVGGSTTVNWTSSFRTPEQTLRHWANAHLVAQSSPGEMRSWFENREQRLNISPWAGLPNENNAVLQRGCQALGWSTSLIPRNVLGCWNLGYCGFGCPTNAKQSMLTTTIPAALDKGATLMTSVRAERLVQVGDTIHGLVCHPVAVNHVVEQDREILLKARHYVLAAGAIGSPAVLLRSGVSDPYERAGKRTFLHPVVATIADMGKPVDPYYGAPQSVYSDEFLWRDGVTGKMGYKLEVPPLHPSLSAGVIGLHGQELMDRMRMLPQMNSVLALLRDGFNDESQGGEVFLRDGGHPGLRYELNDYLWEGAKDAYLKMAEVQFAGGARTVRLVHLDSNDYSSWSEARAAIKAMPMAAQRTKLFSAHVMGGCAMGENAREAVVDTYGQHHQVSNLSVMDGSVFPTSIGANPQLSIYGLVYRNARRLAERLTTA